MSKKNFNKKISYNLIIENIIKEHKKISTSEIIKIFKEKYPILNNKIISTKSIRHTLSFKKKFLKTNEKNQNGRGYMWVLNSNNEINKKKKQTKNNNFDIFFEKNKIIYSFLTIKTKFDYL